MAKKRVIFGESGGPTPVIDWEVAGAVDEAQKAGWEVYGMINGLEGLLHGNVEGNVVDLTKIDPMSFAFNGPGACLRTTRIKPKEEQYKRIGENLDAFGIDAVVYFGGNDSADQLRGLGAFTDAQLIHGIKTVDNDLPVTHHSPGYGSASLYNATALKNVHSDYSSYRVRGNYKSDGEVKQGWGVAPVAIYQVMGRKAGWLAQATGFAKVDPKGDIQPDRPPHIILSREVPFSQEIFLEQLQELITRLGEAVIVVQEDLTDAQTGESLAEKYTADVERDEHGNIQHGVRR
ncbi:MAG: 6-phosphofructokinase, partial [Planctomycetes bacterium]|nr:6-phosphofructokinase [Planctomycetota bacterium]